MPFYVYYCRACQREVSVMQTMSEHERGARCPQCGSEDLEPRLGSFYSKTSRKS